MGAPLKNKFLAECLVHGHAKRGLRLPTWSGVIEVPVQELLAADSVDKYLNKHVNFCNLEL